jgi:hypothetical protein
VGRGHTPSRAPARLNGPHAPDNDVPLPRRHRHHGLALALTTAAPATADKPSDSTTGTTGKPGVGHCLRIDTVKVKGRRPSRPPA